MLYIKECRIWSLLRGKENSVLEIQINSGLFPERGFGLLGVAQSPQDLRGEDCIPRHRTPSAEGQILHFAIAEGVLLFPFFLRTGVVPPSGFWYNPRR